MIKGLKQKWELNGRLLKNGDKLHIKCNPSENIYWDEIFIFKDNLLIKDDRILEIDSIYIDKMELMD